MAQLQIEESYTATAQNKVFGRKLGALKPGGKQANPGYELHRFGKNNFSRRSPVLGEGGTEYLLLILQPRWRESWLLKETMKEKLP